AHCSIRPANDFYRGSVAACNCDSSADSGTLSVENSCTSSASFCDCSGTIRAALRLRRIPQRLLWLTGTASRSTPGVSFERGAEQAIELFGPVELQPVTRALKAMDLD